MLQKVLIMSIKQYIIFCGYKDVRLEDSDIKLIIFNITLRQRRAVGNVSVHRCASDCRSRCRDGPILSWRFIVK